SDLEAGSAAGPGAGWMFVLQILTGNLIAGAMWLTAAQLIERHWPPSRVESPAWIRVKRDLDKTSDLLRTEREKLGLVRAGFARVSAKRAELLTKASEMYKLAVS